MNIIEYIKTDEIKGIIKNIMNAKFVLEMQDGSLSDDKFKYYLIQDDIYLKYYKEAGTKIKNNTKNNGIIELYDAIGSDEPVFHLQMLDKFGIKKENITEDLINYTTYSYINHLIRWSEDSDYNGMLSMLPCQWSYEYIAENSNVKSDKYSFWFDFYKSDGYIKITAKYFDILKDLELTGMQKNIFKFGLLYELNYWICSYNGI